MKNLFKNKYLIALSAAAMAGALLLAGAGTQFLEASSHREAPYIAYDPLADNTDLYAFRDPNDNSMINIIANYIPFELPQGGPNYHTFGENVRYEIHIKNDVNTTGDDIIYRFTFTRTNEAPNTFFNIRLGQENLQARYTLEKSTDGGVSFTSIVTDGYVPPYNIGPRSIQNPTVGLGAADYNSLRQQAILTASTGEKVFCGPSDDPFFLDLGAIFDLANIRPNAAVDGLANYNTHSIALQIPIAMLQKDGKTVDQVTSILDGEFVIGVWASASRPKIKTFNGDGTTTESGEWVQVSRLGMPLTNEVIIPIGEKDKWNTLTPYEAIGRFDTFFVNPELALYMDPTQFADAVPGFNDLRIQNNSLGQYNFRNLQDGLFPLKGTAAVQGTALADDAFGDLLLQDNRPRSVDILPIFLTGVPNLPPYQLAVNKNGNPLAPGKPFVNNFLPTRGDLLRLNMAVPVTDRSSTDFSSLGLVQAAVLGLTDSRFNTTTDLEFIPNMDGFPNGRRLEDDVTRIELQAVSGVVLAAIGLPYTEANTSLEQVLGFTIGVESNDTTFASTFPYVQTPWEGFGNGTGKLAEPPILTAVDFGSPEEKASRVLVTNYPNPFSAETNVKYRVKANSNITIRIFDAVGRPVETLVKGQHTPGSYEVKWNAKGQEPGIYHGSVSDESTVIGSFKMIILE